MENYGNIGFLNIYNDKIISKYQPLVRSIARQYHKSGEPEEDLEQIGYLGLLNALQLFNEKRGVKFITYATWLINGEIRHYLRDKHTIVKIPPWIKEFNRKIDQYVENYHKEHKTFPSLEQIANMLNITEDGVREVLKGRKSVQVVSLDKSLRNAEQDNVPLVDQIKSKEYRSFQLPIEDIIHLKNTLSKLKKVQKQVIYYLFYKDLSQTNVARMLGVTQKQVSRIKLAALDELRKNI